MIYDDAQPQAEFSTENDTDPLLSNTRSGCQYQASSDGEAPSDHLEDGITGVELCDNIPPAKRQLGIITVVFLIFNRMVGTGIFATPSVILRSAGSVGVSLLMWFMGAMIAAAGTAVYVELGSGLPRSGGEKNYLEFIYRRPKYLITCVYAVYVFFQGSGTANCLVFSEYLIHVFYDEPTTFITRFVAFLCLTFGSVMHGIFPKWGIRLQTALGLFKLVALFLIGLTGLLHAIGVPGFELRDGVDIPNNFSAETLWEGSTTSFNTLVTGMMYVLWSFSGYSSANSVLSEIRDPVWTIKRAAPVAIIAITLVYTLVNLAYFFVVSKRDILDGGQIVAALFFGNLFGPATERVLSMVMALSGLGNVLSVLFTHSRVIQELGREGVLPYSSFFASNEPFNTPLSGLFTQWLIASFILISIPPGDAFLFMLNMPMYIVTMTNTVLAIGLLMLHTSVYKTWNWNPPFRAFKWTITFYSVANLLLIAIPFIPPAPGTKLYLHLPYWTHAVVAWLMPLFGIAFWYHQFVWLPRHHGYQLERKVVLQRDGTSRFNFHTVLSK